MTIPDYVSPFAMPGHNYCNDHEQAKDYPFTHMADAKCPFHVGNLERMGKMPKNEAAEEWRNWAMWREVYATVDSAGDKASKEMMLSFVTETNPPMAVPQPRIVKRVPPWAITAFGIFVVVVLCLVVILADI